MMRVSQRKPMNKKKLQLRLSDPVFAAGIESWTHPVNMLRDRWIYNLYGVPRWMVTEQLIEERRLNANGSR